MSPNEIAIGSRGSALALAQARLVVDAFGQHGQPSRTVIIQTEGDRRSPDTAWGEGAFVAAIEQALLEGRVDAAVHSAKDVPTEEDQKLRIAAFLPRADARDALVVRAGAEAQGIDELPRGSRVGTDSPRRTGFLLARRPDLVLHPLHGNVDTRLRRLEAGETDALVLACAGLDRLGLGDRIAERLDPEVVPPAPGQGALAVQIRRDNPRMLALATAIDHPPTRAAVESERAFLAASGGGCRAPIGALATIEDGELVLLGGYARPDGSATAVGRRRGPVADGLALGRALAAELDSRIRRGGITGATDGQPGMRPRVIVTRASEQAGGLVSALRAAGLAPTLVPTIAVELEPPRGDLDRAAGLLHTYAWVVITSANGARAILAAADRTRSDLGPSSWAAIGSATSRVLEREGIAIHYRPRQARAIALAAELPINPGDRVLVVRGDLGDAQLAVALRARGAAVDDVVAYRTLEAPPTSRVLLRRGVAEGPIAAVLFTSGSTIRGLVTLGQQESVDVLSIPCVCIGPATADEAVAAGFRVLAVSTTPEWAALAAATAGALALQPQEMT